MNFLYNQRGMLLAEETLKMVIAVIALIVLVGFLTSLYFSNKDSTKSLEAESVLNRISAIIGNLDEGGVEIYEVPNPEGWNFFSFVKGVNEDSNLCSGENCICVCDEVLFGSQEKECLKNGRCLESGGLSPFEIIPIKGPNEGMTKLNIQKSNNIISIDEIK